MLTSVYDPKAYRAFRVSQGVSMIPNQGMKHANHRQHRDRVVPQEHKISLLDSGLRIRTNFVARAQGLQGIPGRTISFSESDSG